MKKKYKITIGIIGAIIVLTILIGGFLSNKFPITGKVTGEEILEDLVNLSFYDSKTACKLSGDLYVEDNFIGEVKNGELFLNREEYIERFGSDVEVKLKGLTDYCFEDDIGLPFVEFWVVSGEEDSFLYDKFLEFETEINPRWPVYPEAMQGFVRPYEVKEIVSGIKFDDEDSYLEDLERIFRYTYMNYVSDKGQFGEIEYWQTPKEFRTQGLGDCEDWALYAVSLLRAYDSNLDCYAASWYTHVNVVCSINETFIMFDQEKTMERFSIDEGASFQENQGKTRRWKDSYFDAYGIKPNERILFYLFNEEEFIEFEDGRTDFTDWVVNKGLGNI